MDFFILSYYQMIIAWALIYLVYAMVPSPLRPPPWNRHDYPDGSKAYFEDQILRKSKDGYENGPSAHTPHGHLVFALG